MAKTSLISSLLFFVTLAFASCEAKRPASADLEVSANTISFKRVQVATRFKVDTKDHSAEAPNPDVSCAIDQNAILKLIGKVTIQGDALHVAVTLAPDFSFPNCNLKKGYFYGPHLYGSEWNQKLKDDGYGSTAITQPQITLQSDSSIKYGAPFAALTRAKQVASAAGGVSAFFQVGGQDCGRASIAFVASVISGHVYNYFSAGVTTSNLYGKLKSLSGVSNWTEFAHNFSRSEWTNIERSVNVGGYPAFIGLGGEFTHSIGHYLAIVAVNGEEVTMFDPNPGSTFPKRDGFIVVSKSEINNAPGHSIDGKALWYVPY